MCNHLNIGDSIFFGIVGRYLDLILEGHFSGTVYHAATLHDVVVILQEHVSMCFLLDIGICKSS